MRSSPIKINSSLKWCPRCQLERNTALYFRKRGNGTAYEAYCKDCTREYNRVASRRHPHHKSKPQMSKDPQKRKARNLFQSAVRWGKLKREPCVKCGDIKSEGHHSDYSKPYDVIWLCKVHHGQVHWKGRARGEELK